MSKKTEQEEIKVILVGEAGTGKTSLINTSIGMEFKDFLPSSATNSFAPKEIKIDGKKYILNLWDTIGQEQFRSLTKIFIKDSKIVIFVYDITNEKSFVELDYWIRTINDILKDEPILAIAGNKQDLFLKEKVKEERAKKFAQERNIHFQLTSAKNKKSFEKLLEDLLKKYIEKYGNSTGNANKGVKLGEGDEKDPNKKKCC